MSSWGIANRLVTSAAALLILTQCSRPSSGDVELSTNSNPPLLVREVTPRIAARHVALASARDEAATEALAGTTYEDQGSPYGCTEDCSGHDAGYEWAKNQEMTDASDCSGNSQSFIEGCEAYAEAYEAAKEQAESESEAEGAGSDDE